MKGRHLFFWKSDAIGFRPFSSAKMFYTISNRFISPMSLYDPIYSDGGDTIYVLDQVGDNNDDKNWLSEIALKEEIKNLSQREKHILSLRFIQGLTQMEVSQEIGISQAQVSRLEKGALDKIKS